MKPRQQAKTDLNTVCSHIYPMKVYVMNKSILLTWDENDPACAFLNGKTEAEIIAMIESGLESLEKEEEAKQARLKALEQLTEHDQKMGLY